MSDWYSVGHVEAEKMAASTQNRRVKNFFTKPGESARIRFLKPARDSFNYKRAFVKWAKGQKLLTSPGSVPDPFVEAGLKLQAAFAWPIIDRRVFEFTDDSGEDKKIGPRTLLFADGQRTRKQLLAFEKEMLAMANEEREEEGLDPLVVDEKLGYCPEFNLSSYDLKVSKEKGAPWNFVAMKPKDLSKDDEQLLEKTPIDLQEELKPLPAAELRVLLNGGSNEVSSESKSDETAYSYSDDDDDTISFND